MSEQHLKALEMANSARAAHSELRAKIKELSREEGLLEVARLLDIEDQRIGGLSLARLIGYCHKVGPQISAWIFARAQVSGHKLVRELAASQRSRLVIELRRRANG